MYTPSAYKERTKLNIDRVYLIEGSTYHHFAVNEIEIELVSPSLIECAIAGIKGGVTWKEHRTCITVRMCHGREFKLVCL